MIETKPLKCFRCGEEIKDIFYVKTLSGETAHTYCQATGVKPKQEANNV